MSSTLKNIEDIEGRAAYQGSPKDSLSTQEKTRTPEIESVDEASPPPFTVFTNIERSWIVFLVGLAALFSPMSSFIYSPAIHSIATSLGTSVQKINLTVTSYMVVSGVVPALLGNFADMRGRRPAYMVTFTIYVAANIGLALQNSFPALLVLRMLQSAGSSATISLGYGVMSDIATRDERAKFIGYYLIGPNTAPPLGPVIGGVIDAHLGWPYIFWFLTAFSGLCLALLICTLPETARRIVGNGSIRPWGFYKSLLPIRAHSMDLEVPEVEKKELQRFNPLRSLRVILEKDSAIIIGTNGIFYAIYSCIQISIATLFMDIYNYGELEAGLIYLPFGVGCLVATIVSGTILSKELKRWKKALNVETSDGDDFPIEKARLGSIFISTILTAVVLVGYGWSLEKKVSVAVPLVMQAILGVTISLHFTCLNTLQTDLHWANSSTASAANNMVRCAFSAAATAVLQLLIDSIGVGWCFTLIGAICGLCTPLLFLERQKGRQWRLAYQGKKAV